jgi:hypothetical protein
MALKIETNTPDAEVQGLFHKNFAGRAEGFGHNRNAVHRLTPNAPFPQHGKEGIKGAEFDSKFFCPCPPIA